MNNKLLGFYSRKPIETHTSHPKELNRDDV